MSILNPAGFKQGHPGSPVPYPEDDTPPTHADTLPTFSETCLQTHTEAQCNTIVDHQNHVAYGVVGVLAVIGFICARKGRW